MRTDWQICNFQARESVWRTENWELEPSLYLPTEWYAKVILLDMFITWRQQWCARIWKTRATGFPLHQFPTTDGLRRGDGTECGGNRSACGRAHAWHLLPATMKTSCFQDPRASHQPAHSYQKNEWMHTDIRWRKEIRRTCEHSLWACVWSPVLLLSQIDTRVSTRAYRYEHKRPRTLISSIFAVWKVVPGILYLVVIAWPRNGVGVIIPQVCVLVFANQYRLLCWSGLYDGALGHRTSFGLCSTPPRTENLRKSAYALVCSFPGSCLFFRFFPLFRFRVLDFDFRFSTSNCFIMSYTDEQQLKMSVRRIFRHMQIIANYQLHFLFVDVCIVVKFKFVRGSILNMSPHFSRDY